MPRDVDTNPLKAGFVMKCVCGMSASILGNHHEHKKPYTHARM